MKKVLVADDNPVIRQLLRITLKAAGNARCWILATATWR